VIVRRVDIQYVILYRTQKDWRISVHQGADGIGCGSLPRTAPDAPIEVAQEDLRQHLRQHWGFTGELTWHQTKPDWWSAEVQRPTQT
jgi:hypothetical protein